MTVRRVNPAELAPPAGFSHVVVAEGSTIVFLAGQTALNPQGTVIGTTITEQFDTALANLLAALSEVGGEPRNLAKVTIFCIDPGDYRHHATEIGKIWQRRAGRDFPAMTLVGVTRLWDEDALLEVDGIAVLP